MDRKTVIVLTACLWTATSIRAQETVTFDIRYSDPVLTPGEVQHIEVWAILSPGPGSPVTWNPPVGLPHPGVLLQFTRAVFNLTNVQHGQTGMFSDLVVPPPFSQNPVSSPGLPDGSGGVLDIKAFQLFFPPWNPSNPIHLWSSTWTPNDYSPRTVEFSTLATQGPTVTLELSWSPPWVDEDWLPLYAPASFQVIPAPATLIVPALFGLLGLTRRRREA
ncbi:MAG: hypothetical protein ACKVU4_14375 [Phycisphaerales bacterium]